MLHLMNNSYTFNTYMHVICEDNMDPINDSVYLYVVNKLS